MIDDVRLVRATLTRMDPGWRTASYASGSLVGFVLRVVADGVVGLGATAAHPNQISPDALEAELRTIVVPALIGAAPSDGDGVRAHLRTRGVHARAMLAADLALHDLDGRLAGVPCYARWGGAARTSVSVVRMVGLKEPADLLATVDALVAEGYDHLKIKLGGGVDEDVQRIALVRARLGPTIWIGVDGNGAYSLADAIRLSRGLAPHAVSVLEQPVPYDDLDALRDLTAVSPVPIMADQCVTDAASALEVCRRRAADIVSIKLTKMGSVEEARRVAEVCRTFGVGVHIGGSAAPALVDMAQAHLAVSCDAIAPEGEVGEFMSLVGDPIRGVAVSGGRLRPGTDAGFGAGLAPEASTATTA